MRVRENKLWWILNWVGGDGDVGKGSGSTKRDFLNSLVNEPKTLWCDGCVTISGPWDLQGNERQPKDETHIICKFGRLSETCHLLGKCVFLQCWLTFTCQARMSCFLLDLVYMARLPWKPSRSLWVKGNCEKLVNQTDHRTDKNGKAIWGCTF